MSQTWIYLFLLVTLGIHSKTDTDQNRVMEELCDNAIDDDGDGLIDLNDPDCVCEIVNLESLIPNPSFENFSCCPETDSQLDCAVEWDQASFATTDFLHTCGYLSVGERMLPFPDGDGAVLFLDGSFENSNGFEVYKEYAGVCLNFPMLMDSIYKFKFHLGFLDKASSPDIKFTFFGSPDCSNLPFTQSTDCPTNYPDWHLLTSKIVRADKDSPTWVEVSVEIQPSLDINALVIGGPCLANTSDMLGVYFLDNLRLNDISNFDFELIDEVSPCDQDFVFAVVDDPNSSYQWYKEGIALVGETNAQLSQMYGEGIYQLGITDQNTLNCRIADGFEFLIPTYEHEDFKTICENESLLYNGDVIEDAGTYEFNYTSVDGCDSIVILNVVKELNKVDTIYAQILPGIPFTIDDNQFETAGQYEINLTTTNGCDSLVILFLENINVFIPNIFSPNDDGYNDYFEVYSSDNNILMTEMSIFDKWGGLIYKGNRWDGKHYNIMVNPGVFVYFIRLVNMDGEEEHFSGSITVIR